MPQIALDFAQTAPFVQQKRSASMPQVVESHSGEVAMSDFPSEMVSDVLRREQFAVGVYKDVGGIRLTISAAVCSVLRNLRLSML